MPQLPASYSMLEQGSLSQGRSPSSTTGPKANLPRGEERDLLMANPGRGRSIFRERPVRSTITEENQEEEVQRSKRVRKLSVKTVLFCLGMFWGQSHKQCHCASLQWPPAFYKPSAPSQAASDPIWLALQGTKCCYRSSISGTVQDKNEPNDHLASAGIHHQSPPELCKETHPRCRAVQRRHLSRTSSHLPNWRHW